MTFIRGGRADHNRPGPGVSPPKPSLIIRSSDNLRHNGVTVFSNNQFGDKVQTGAELLYRFLNERMTADQSTAPAKTAISRC